MKSYLEDLLPNSSQKDCLRDMRIDTSGETMLAVLVCSPRSCETQEDCLFMGLTASLEAIIHVIAILTLFGYAQHYYFHFRKCLSLRVPRATCLIPSRTSETQCALEIGTKECISWRLYVHTQDEIFDEIPIPTSRL